MCAYNINKIRAYMHINACGIIRFSFLVRGRHVSKINSAEFLN